MNTLRTRASLILRAIAIVLLVVGIVSPVVHLRTEEVTVVFVVDRSASVGPEALADAGRMVTEAYGAAAKARIGAVGVADRAEVVLPIGAPLPEAPLFRTSNTVGTALADGIALARSMMPASGHRRIVVVSDGFATEALSDAALEGLAQEGVHLDTYPLAGSLPSEAIVASAVATPDRAALGQPIEVAATVFGLPWSTHVVGLSRDGTSIATDTATIGEDGACVVVFVDPRPEEGFHQYEVTLASRSGAGATASTAVVVDDRPHVLIVGSEHERPALLTAALDEAKALVETIDLEREDFDPARLEGIDLVVLNDVPIARRGEVRLIAGLDRDHQQALVDFVSKRGGGLLVGGGAFGFGPDYDGTPLARALPVAIENAGQVEDPDVSMAVMLDRSGSMGAFVGEHTKIELAIEAALAAASALRTTDTLGIASVDEYVHWDVPLGPVSELAAHRDAIRRITADGGGIYVYTALADAYEKLGRRESGVRHVLLFSDTEDSEEQFMGCPFLPCAGSEPSAIDLAKTATQAGITTSVVGIGPAEGTDTLFLRKLAAAGGGRFYLTAQGVDLRRIFVAETRATARTNIDERTMTLRAAGASPMLGGVDVSGLPPVEGMVRTGRRLTAETALVVDDRPVLATWRYGLGMVTAWTSDLGGRWTEAWAQSEAAGQLLRQVARGSMKSAQAHAVDVEVERSIDSLAIEVRAPEAETVAPDKLPATVEISDVHRFTATLDRVDADNLRAVVPRPVERPVLLRVLAADGSTLSEEVIAPLERPEFTGEPSDVAALEELARRANGRFAPEAASLVQGDAEVRTAAVSLGPPLLLLAALFVCADLWCRRIGRVRRRNLAEIAGARRTAAHCR